MSKVILIILAACSVIFVSCARNSIEEPISSEEPISGSGTGNKKSGEAPLGNVSCMLDRGIACSDFVGRAWSSSSINQQCAQYKGIIVLSKCETKGLVLECLLSQGTDDEIRIKYYYPSEKFQIENECVNAGGQAVSP